MHRVRLPTGATQCANAILKAPGVREIPPHQRADPRETGMADATAFVTAKIARSGKVITGANVKPGSHDLTRQPHV